MSRLGRPDRDPSAMRKRKHQANGPSSSHDAKKIQEVKKPKNVPYTQEEHDLEVSLFGHASRAEPIASTSTSTSTSTSASKTSVSKSSTSKSSVSASPASPTTRLTSHHDDAESNDDDDLEAAAVAWDQDKSGYNGDIETFMFAEDKSGSTVVPGDEDVDVDVDVDEDGEEKKTATSSTTPIIPIETSVWHDEDDDTVQVNLAVIPKLRKLREHEGETVISGGEYQKRLRNTFQQLNPTATWAKLPESTTSKKHDPDAADDDEKDITLSDLLTGTTSLGATSTSGRLQPTHLHVTRMKDANMSEPNQSVVQSLVYHPNGQLLMTGGLDKTIRLFQIDGLRNPKIQGIHLTDLPIHQAAFTSSGDELIITGRRKYFYVMDLHSQGVTKIPFIKGRPEKSLEHFVISPDAKYIAFLGNDGYIILVHHHTKQWVGNLKMNGTVHAAAFSPEGERLYAIGGDGQVYVFDMRRLRCEHRFIDDGCLNGTAIAVSSDHQYLATGSSSGVVNVYSTSSLFSATNTSSLSIPSPTPLKALLNLTTAIDHLHFNHDTQLLLMASRRKKDALRMIHLPSLTTYANWPTSNTPLHYVSSVTFSPNSGYLACGNDRGKVLLYRLNHFSLAS